MIRALHPQPFWHALRRWTVVLVALPLLAACADQGLMTDRGPYWISEVNVRVPAGLGATGAFADRVRTAMLDAAWAWSESGTEKRLIVTVNRYQIFRTGRVMIHADSSFADAKALLVDRQTGRRDALTDITGLVTHPAGAVGRWIPVNQAVEEAGIAASMADALMRRLHGEDYAEIQAERPTTGRRAPRDPVDSPIARSSRAGPASWDRKFEMGCIEMIERALSDTRTDLRLSPHCRALGYRLPKR